MKRSINTESITSLHYRTIIPRILSVGLGRFLDMDGSRKTAFSLRWLGKWYMGITI